LYRILSNKSLAIFIGKFYIFVSDKRKLVIIKVGKEEKG